MNDIILGMFTIKGVVIAGNKRGRALGFPTANINIKKGFLEGIYLSETDIDKKLYPSLTFIGEAKTFAQTEYLSETYILDFQQDIYNKIITVKISKKIRENKKFDSIEELVIQMKEDEKVARKYFQDLVDRNLGDS